MKQLFLLLLFLSLVSSRAQAQLDPINFMDLPCNCMMGGSSVISTNLVSNATYYTWYTAGPVNNVLFNNQAPGPVQTTVNSVTISCLLPSSFVVICVTANSVNDSSNTFCDTIWNEVPVPVFSGLNSNVVLPNTSGLYFMDSTTCPPYQYLWTVTGDIIFDNGWQTISTFDPSVNLNFGPGFTNGFLCVQGLGSTGLLSDTICMAISTTVGVKDIHSPDILFYYQESSNQLTLDFKVSLPQVIVFNIYDLTGRIIYSENIYANQKQIVVVTPPLESGIYFAEVSGSGFRETFKFSSQQ
ncbi:MAG: T9SS type A sorting domain-containing protein [Bacteroidota bacterium]|nr:T9SS type A sorting domain-containing protein [Bacteroidota bacterium]